MSTHPSDRARVTRSDVVAGFRATGVDVAAVVIVHSSLSSMGRVDGGAPAVVEALLEVVGPDGTLVMPTLCQKAKERRFEVWDIHTSPSDVGLVTETFRTWPGAVRSDHATHSVAALGPLAHEITAGHATAGPRPGPWGDRAFGHGSPWEHLDRLNAHYAFLGVTFSVLTLGHYIQACLVEDIMNGLDRTSADGFRAQLAGWCKPGLWPTFRFADVEAPLTERGLVRYAEIGAATLRVARAAGIAREVRGLLVGDPSAWLEPDWSDWLARAGLGPPNERVPSGRRTV